MKRRFLVILAVLPLLAGGCAGLSTQNSTATAVTSDSGSNNDGQNTGVNPNSHYKEGYLELWKRLPEQTKNNRAWSDWALQVKKTGDYKGAFEQLVKKGRYDSRPEWDDYLAWVRGEK